MREISWVNPLTEEEPEMEFTARVCEGRGVKDVHWEKVGDEEIQ